MARIERRIRESLPQTDGFERLRKRVIEKDRESSDPETRRGCQWWCGQENRPKGKTRIESPKRVQDFKGVEK